VTETHCARVWHAFIIEEFHSFACTPKLLSTIVMSHNCLCHRSWSWSSFFSDPRVIEGWVGLVTTMVSKQSARDRYVMDITVVSCSHRHTLLGNCSAVAVSVRLVTFRFTSRDAIHRVTQCLAVTCRPDGRTMLIRVGLLGLLTGWHCKRWLTQAFGEYYWILSIFLFSAVV